MTVEEPKKQLHVSEICMDEEEEHRTLNEITVLLPIRHLHTNSMLKARQIIQSPTVEKRKRNINTSKMAKSCSRLP